MPNYCENILIVKGDLPEDFELDFNKIIPEPENKDECPLAYQHPDHLETGNKPWFDWYHWRIDHWNTKWNAAEVTRNGNTFYFDTAWSPPVPVVYKLMELYPDCHFTLKYYEPGNLLGGIVSNDGVFEASPIYLKNFAINEMGYTEEDFDCD